MVCPDPTTVEVRRRLETTVVGCPAMRLWSLHPSLLDRAALVAGWREGLLAQAVLLGRTKGYRSHPQLERFRTLGNPVGGIVTWLEGLADEADARGYRFDRSRLAGDRGSARLEVTDGQLALELEHLRRKVAGRAPEWLEHLPAPGEPVTPHPMLDVRPGPV
jgi:hypothetical protein